MSDCNFAHNRADAEGMGKLLLIAAMVLLLDDGNGHHQAIPLTLKNGAAGEQFCSYATPDGDRVTGRCPPIYIIDFFDLFQRWQGLSSEGYPGLPSCKAALEQMQFEQGFYGQCRSLEDLNRTIPPARAQSPH